MLVVLTILKTGGNHFWHEFCLC
uniref:Uncharacterized protein n=1 Tax=Arundo donax TaxID=35708 RepID=A0A0A9EEN0_ARUDO